MSKDNAVAALLSKTALTLRQEWIDFVNVAYILTPDSVDDAAGAIAKVSGVGTESIRRRMYGVQKAKTLGYSQAEIIEFGQEKVLSMAHKEKRAESYTQMTKLIFNVPGSQRELVQAQVARVRTILRLTVEDFWDWWLAQMYAASDDDIRHSASVPAAKVRPKDAPKG